jgi:carbon storage regulator
VLVLSRKSGETVVVGEPGDFQSLLKVTVLAIKGANVKLGFEVDADVPVHRSEVWERIIDDGRAESQPSGPLLPAE